MGVSNAVTTDGAKPVSRRDEAYLFIKSYIVRTGQSPSIHDVMTGIGVGKTRAKALVHQLAVAKSIERAPGSQRGISIPGLARELVLEELRREGFVIDRDIISGGVCPQGHLPLIAVLEHLPDIEAGENHDQQHFGRGSDAAGI